MKKLLATVLIWFVCCGFTLAKNPTRARHVHSLVYTTNLVTNGAFDDGSVWELAHNWTIVGGKAVKTFGDGSYFSQAPGLIANSLYLIKATVDQTSSGFQLWIYGGVSGNATQLSTYYDANLLGVITVTADSLEVYTQQNWTGNVDNIECYLVDKAYIRKGRHRNGMDLTH